VKDEAEPVCAEGRVHKFLQEHLETLETEGVSKKLLNDPIVAILMLEALLHKHYLEIHADQDLFNAVFLKIIRLASVADLRDMAAMLQDRGDLDASEDLNLMAAIRSEEIFLNC
jgi:hypothetical protein